MSPDVFRPHRDAVATRIPAIARTHDGVLLAFAELRSTREDTGPIALGLRRSTDDGATWGALIRLTDGIDCARNPVPVVLADGGILLVSCLDPAQAGRDGRPRGAVPTRVRVQRSDDGGVGWTTPRDLGDGVRRPDWSWYATGPGGVDPLASGRVLIPANHRARDRVHRAHVIQSDDGGETWAIAGLIESPGGNEGQLAQLPGGRVLLTLRNRAAGGRELAASDDDGATWRLLPLPPELAGPVCQSDLLAVGSELFATVHRSRTRRRGLRIRRSQDGGVTWPAAAAVGRGPVGYSDQVALPGGRLGVLFERGHRIAFRIVEPRDFRARSARRR